MMKWYEKILYSAVFRGIMALLLSNKKIVLGNYVIEWVNQDPLNTQFIVRITYTG